MSGQDRRMDKFEDIVERQALATEKNKWQMGLILGGITIVGNAIAIPLILRYLGM